MKKTFISNYEKEVKSRIETVINEKFGSMAEFARKINYSPQRLHEILSQRQHLNLTHLGDIVEGLGGEFLQIFSDENYIIENERLTEEEKALIGKIRQSERARQAIMAELARVTAYEEPSDELLKKLVENVELKKFVEYLVNIESIKGYVNPQFEYAKKIFEDDIKKYESEKKQKERRDIS